MPIQCGIFSRLLCVGDAGELLTSHITAVGDTVAPGGTTTFQISLFEAVCSSFLVASDGCSE